MKVKIKSHEQLKELGRVKIAKNKLTVSSKNLKNPMRI